MLPFSLQHLVEDFVERRFAVVVEYSRLYELLDEGDDSSLQFCRKMVLSQHRLDVVVVAQILGILDGLNDLLLRYLDVLAFQHHEGILAVVGQQSIGPTHFHYETIVEMILDI